MTTEKLAVLGPRFAPSKWFGEWIGWIELPIRAKLLIAFAGIAALMIVLSFVGLATLRAANDRTAQLVIDQQRFSVYRQINSQLDESIIKFESILNSPFSNGNLGLFADPESFASLQNDNSEFLKTVADAKRIDGRLVAGDAAYQADLEGLRDDWKRAFAQLDNLTRLLKEDDFPGALNFYIDGVQPIIRKLKLTAVTGSEQLENKMLADAKANDLEYQSNRQAVIAVSTVAVTLALLLGYSISTSIIYPVQKIRNSLREVARGNFHARAVVVNRDELGDLARSANNMTERLGIIYNDLETANKHKSQFLANMSHEFRTPMNSILGYTELIRDEIYGPVPGKIAEPLERVDANGKALLALINDVLDFSKIEAGRFELNMEDYDFAGIVTGAAQTVQPMADEKGLQLVTDVASDLPSVYGDPARTRQVILNIVGNAVKFTDTGGVEVAVTKSGDELRIAVKDTGPGISTEDQADIFDEFRQADTSTTRAVGGTGLGLAISKKITELHGGGITVESIRGGGATFIITMPVRATATASAEV